MTSRKNLKKAVRQVTCNLYIGCQLYKAISTKEQKAEIDKIAKEISEIHDEFVSRISHTEPGNVKGFYKNFETEFDARITKVGERIKQLL